MTEETLAASLAKLGSTQFVCTGIQIDLQNDVFLAKSQLNALRRAAVTALEEKLLAFAKPSCFPERAVLPPVEKTLLRTEKRLRRLFPNTVEGLEKLLAETAACGIESVCLPLTLFEPAQKAQAERAVSLLKQADLVFGVRMPRVVFSCEESAAKNALNCAAQHGARYAVAENIGDLPLIRQSSLALYGGAALNVYNSQTLQFFAENGMTDITLSTELTPPQMRDLRKPPLVKTALIGAGRLELMVLESCVIRACGGCRKTADGAICAHLTDRLGMHFPIRAAHRLGDAPYPCRNVLLNSVALGLAEKPEEIAKTGCDTVCVYENPD